MGVLMTNQRQISNKIVNHKFNISWVPVSLFNKLTQKVNIYFLLLSILTCFKFSPKDPASMILTFLIVLTFQICKDGVENYYNRKSYETANLSKAQVYDYGSFKFKDTTFANVRVGDVILVERD